MTPDPILMQESPNWYKRAMLILTPTEAWNLYILQLTADTCMVIGRQSAAPIIKEYDETQGN